ncbi:MAG: hypothetical protein H7Y27_09225, partial [Gemmatimonadaceae bacterium]|nr:hypothetical protein [Chitinophagaceae bacterium]
DNHMYGDHRTWIAKSADMGKTWKKFESPEFSGFAHKIKEDLKNSELLFAGTEMGLFASADGGANWFRMKNNIPWYSLVRDIRIHPVTNDLILATHGRGIITVDDITPMRSLTKQIIEKDVHLFANEPVVLTAGKFGDGGFPSTGGWNAGNPISIPPIQYYLKDRVNSGDVKIEIYDAAGKLVQSLPGTKRKGVNKVLWNLRMKPPKVASGGSRIDFGGFVAPMVLPGEYTVKLKVGDKEYSQSMKLLHDDGNKLFSETDRQLQFSTAMELYNLHESLAKQVEDITAKEKMLKDNMSKVKSPKVKKLLQEYYDKLEALRGSLLATKMQSMFADEEKLRERITDVYAAVAGQEAAPGNLQIQRISVLKEELAVAEKSNVQLTEKYFNKVKDALAKEGVDKPAIKDSKEGK